MLRLADMVRHLCGKVYEYHALTVPVRLRSEVLRYAGQYDGGNNTASVSPVPTDSDIASRIGATREAVNRAMVELVDRSIVVRDSQEFTDSDIAALRRLVNTD